MVSVQASEVDALKTLVLELRTELRTLKNERSQQSFAHSISVPQQHQTTRSFHDQTPRHQRSRTEPVCWRCNMPGDVRSGCRMPLNGNAFVGRGSEFLPHVGGWGGGRGKTTVNVIVNGRMLRALLDTGITVSVISREKVD